MTALAAGDSLSLSLSAPDERNAARSVYIFIAVVVVV